GGAAAALGVLSGHNQLAAGKDEAIDEYSLSVEYSRRQLGPFSIRTRTYNSQLPGPLMITRPGRTLVVKLRNQLPADPPETAPPGIDPLNNPHAFNTTNLHLHGMQVIPHLFKPVGTVDPKAPLIRISSNGGHRYQFTIPDDHPSGLYW